MKGYFGKVDNQHPGNENDPRVSLIEVVPQDVSDNPLALPARD